MARQRGNRWQADALVDGKRQRRSFATEREAEAWEAAQAPKAGRLQATSDQPAETMQKMAERLQEQLWGRGDQAVAALRHVKEAVTIITDIPMKDFNTTRVEELTTAYMRGGNSDSTINRKYATFSKLCKHAVRTEVLAKMPWFDRKKEPEGRQRYLTAKEVTKLFAALKAISERTYDMAVFLVDTGCRCSEAHDLKWKWVDFDKGALTFTGTKADLTRVVPMTKRVKAMLELRKDLATPFADMNRWTFRQHWYRARVKAGLGDDKDVVPHILRHTCASRLVQSGVPLYHVQKWLGHKSASMTERYSKLAPDTLSLAVGKLEAYA